MKPRSSMLKCAGVGALLATLGAVALSAPAFARDHGHGHYHGYDRGGYRHGGHVTWDIWIGGNWRHDWYGGRYGWWWVAGPDWYYYPQPVYPYPYPYPQYQVVVPQAPSVGSGPPPAQNWYYCESPKGYYPYVQQCSTAWREVPATPSGPVK